LARLYRDLGRLLRPGGLFLNGDHMAFNSALPTFTRLSQQVLDEHWTDAAFASRGIETAEQWWDALAGFREVGTIWQVLSNRVLLAVR
jgi:hypothetical protein